ncbi:unnamed protein product [Dovyalis caffra]|uniref:ABC1 atypical kinase-like domain-containing protein n=1 Tax=Dovyalis caffra TaxID=77055 RepID=A0AAV1RPE1_9ROSI|nr:unnamed protein product [Dovyalis caffra]
MEHPGNIAVDDVNGGRLIFYDFGMMGSISPNIREGLLEAFYGIYEKDPDKVLEAMIQMGVLVPTGDMTAVRRTAQFFLKRKARQLADTLIGEDLLSIAADQPFRFPATFTFVVRAFSVLDGIGKGLDPRFDITEIAKPYALELLKFREAGVEVLLKDFRKRWDRQSRAFYNLFRQADRVQKLADTIQRLEQGDLKLRVRTLEAERAFQRVAAVQKTVGSAVAAGSLVNLATILYLNSIRVPAIVASIFCAFFSFQILFGIIKVKKLDQQERDGQVTCKGLSAVSNLFSYMMLPQTFRAARELSGGQEDLAVDPMNTDMILKKPDALPFRSTIIFVDPTATGAMRIF